MRMRKRALVLVWISAASPLACKSSTESRSILLTANIAAPADLDAVSQFNSCAGHAYPEPTSPNSGKNYFWPNSTNFSTNDVLKLFAACDGVTGQNNDDTDDPNEYIQGQTIHLYCDASGTGVRYFHIIYPPGSLGQHVSAGAFIGYASLLQSGAAPASSWQESENFDIAVIEGDDDSKTVDYFAALDASAFAAWAERGVTSVAQTIYPGNQTCTTYSSNIGDPWIIAFSPAH
jgi:hypothetical protein